MSEYDFIAIGGGSGGIAAARRAAAHGAKALVVEQSKLGGTCVNVGCVPKKVMWYAANAADALQHASDFGFEFAETKLDFSSLVEKRHAYIKRLNGIYANLLENSNVDLVRGEASFVDEKTIAVDGKQFSAKHILVATGSLSAVPNLPGAELGGTSDDFFKWNQLPKRVVIVGAGYIAVEIAGVLASLGSKVTLLVRGARVLKEFDEMLSSTLLDSLIKQGVSVEFGVSVTGLQKSDDGLVAKLSNEECLRTDELLWATGRYPNTETLSLEKAGVKLNDKNAIIVDEMQATSAPNIYAVGDVIGYGMLTPVAIAAGRRLVDRLFGNIDAPPVDYETIPTVVFSHPAIGTVGLSENDARAKYGNDVKVYTSSFTPMVYALNPESGSKTRMKLIVFGAEERVVGMHIIGKDADELLQGFAVAVRLQLPKSALDETIAIHPTTSEEFVTMR